MGVDVGDQRGDLPRRIGQHVRREILVDEIDRRLLIGQEAEQAGAPAFVERPQLAGQLTARLAALRLGLGGDQIGQALGGGQVELTGDEGAFGELAGLGQP